MKESIIQKNLSVSLEELGPNLTTILNFWLYVESLSEERKNEITQLFYSTENKTIWTKVSEAASKLTNELQVWNGVVDATTQLNPEKEGFFQYAVAWATHELIAAHLLIEEGYDFPLIKVFQ